MEKPFVVYLGVRKKRRVNLSAFENKCKICGNKFKITEKKDEFRIDRCLTYNCSQRSLEKKIQQLFEGSQLEEQLKIFKENQQATKRPLLVRLIEKYGKEVGEIKYKEILKKCDSSLKGYIRRYGEVEGRLKFEAFSKKSAHTKEKYIEKFGEEKGTRIWDDMRKKKRETSKRSLDYWLIKANNDKALAEHLRAESQAWTLTKSIQKYGKEGEEKYRQYVKSKTRKNNLQGYIEEYGEEKGKEEWDKGIKKRKWSLSYEGLVANHGEEKANEIIEKRNPRAISITSTKIFDILSKEILLNFPCIQKIYYGDTEYFINLKKEYKCMYFLDFYIKEIPLAIEFYGDYWHANPEIYKPSDRMYNGSLAVDIWKKDQERCDRIQEYIKEPIYIIWEKDWKNNSENIIKEILCKCKRSL